MAKERRSPKKKLNLKNGTKSGFMKGSGDEVRITNRYINEVNNDLFEIYAALNRNGEPITAEKIKNKFIGQAALLPQVKLYSSFSVVLMFCSFECL